MLGRLLRKKDVEQPQWGDELADYVNNEYKRRQTERRPWELQWRLNMEFLNGNQYLDINASTMTLEEIPKLYWWQEREVFNQIATISETRIARLTRTKPLMKVRPATGAEEDVSAAKVSSLLLSSSWDDQCMDDTYTDFIAWLEVTGTALLKPTWSVDRGQIIFQGWMLKQEEEEKSREEGQPEEADPVFGANYEYIELREGDIETTVVPAHEFFPDSPWRDSLRQCRSVIHARAYHIDEIEEMWGQRVEEEEVDAISLQRVSSGLGSLGHGYGTFRTQTAKLKKHAVLKEYYERPSKKYPEGRFIVVAGNKCLHAGPMPYMIGEDGEPDFPFVRTVSIAHPGCFWGKSVIERLIPVQRRYNALRNRKAEYLNLVAIGQWYEPDGSLEDDTELNNAPGNRIRYRPGVNGAKPEPVQFPSLPASFENEIQTLLAEFTAISGVSELSRYSEAPSGVKSGVALSIASEQDNTRIANTAERIANSIVVLGKYWLRLYKQFAQESRILRSVGTNLDVEVREWDKSMLKSEDVVIENSAALSETPAQRRQMVFDLIATGIFNRPEASVFTEEGKQKILELLEFGHWEGGLEDMGMIQRRTARKENRAIMDGQPAPVQFYDDDPLHIEQHQRAMMSAEYAELMKTPLGPLVDQLMRIHIAEHMQAMIAKMPQIPPGMQDAQPQAM